MNLINHMNCLLKGLDMDTIHDDRYSKLKIRRINLFLPKDFIDFFSFVGRKNYFTYVSYTIKGTEDTYTFGPIYSVDEDQYSILDLTRSLKGRLPRGLVPFSHDFGGDIFVISTRLKDYGSVYLWYHEKEYYVVDSNVKLNNYGDNLEKLADSFSEFILGLEEIIE